MRHLNRNVLIILVVLGLCMLSLWPPKENLRLGKDLAGGWSGIWRVELEPGDSPDVVDQVIEVLSKRVNPNGLFEISFVRQGRDRIEISMPLPTAEVQSLRTALEAAVERVGAYDLDAGAVERALRAPAGEREAALRAMMNTPERTALLEPVVTALEASRAARAAFEAARASGADQATLDQLVDAAGAAEEQLDAAKRRALTTSVSPGEVRSILRRPTEQASIIVDEATKLREKLPSAFDKGIQSLRDRIGAMPAGADASGKQLTGNDAIDAMLAAHQAYLAKARGFDDPADLERMLQGSGVLEFRIAVKPGDRPDEAALRDALHQRGPTGLQAQGVRWYPINKPEDWFKTKDQYDFLAQNPQAFFAQQRLVGDVYGGEYYVLLYDEPGRRLTPAEGNWRLTGVTQGADQLGRPSINFTMDAAGGARLGEMTEPNVGEPMAVMLDGRVYTAPNINSRLSRAVQIEGSFSQREISYLQQTLQAGSLSAKLSEKPLSATRLAPDLGLDNLQKGVRAGVISLILVSAFMVFYYYLAGLVAAIALLCNAIIILGVMSLNNAAFTLPGIAGIVLTFGMAVDSNVLIYERLREELLAGNDLKSAIRVSYQKVLSTIVDSNLTTLIACVVLAYTATQEIKGFAITLGIGVVATMFSALLITRVIFAILVDKIGIKHMSQLPMTFRFIDRLFTPKIDWIALRPVLWGFSALFIGTGIYFIATQRGEMLDTEFRGGVAADIKLSTPEQGESVTFQGKPFTGTLERADVQAVLVQIADEAKARLAADATDQQAAELAKLGSASVVVVGDNVGTTSNWFRIKTVITDQELVLAALMDKFADVVGTNPPLEFAGSDAESLVDAPVHVIEEPVLGENDWFARAEVRDDVSEFIGGAAIVLQNIEPPVSVDDLRNRLDFVRSQGDYVSTTAPRDLRVIVVDGANEAVQTAVILIRDPVVNALFDADTWRTTLATQEWTIAREALAQATTEASVQSFSAEVAATFRAKAIVATAISLLLVGIYIWVRFGSLRYSMACLASTIHDVIAVIGLIAMAEVLNKLSPEFFSNIGIQAYQIDLGMVAAIMTIIGYSLNDSIIILDRIRENRGRLPYATRKVVNDSINQTISRTVITSGTTLVAVLVMLVVGGEGIASFNYALFCGIVVGTFSSIAIAAPIVYTRRIPEAARAIMESAEARETGITTREPSPVG